MGGMRLDNNFDFEDLVRQIPLLDRQMGDLARQRQAELTKPLGSLGQLEDLSVQLAMIKDNLCPQMSRKAIVVMVGDHGVTEEGISAYPSIVTLQMVKNFVYGGAAINVLARSVGARLVVVDIGMAKELEANDCPLTNAKLICRNIAKGARNITKGAAMTRYQAQKAIQVGVEIFEAEYTNGIDLIATGDMGIGNTTASSAIIATICRLPPESVTGRGTGVDDAGLARKISAIHRALHLNMPDPNDPIDVVSKVGGYEIAGLTGVILGAARRRVPVVIDGLVSSAAALLAVGFSPKVRPYLIAGHQSVEIGQKAALDFLGLKPVLDLGMRLGEGTGAALAFPIIEAATRILCEMATFSEAGISQS